MFEDEDQLEQEEQIPGDEPGKNHLRVKVLGLDKERAQKRENGAGNERESEHGGKFTLAVDLDFHKSMLERYLAVKLLPRVPSQADLDNLYKLDMVPR